MAGQTRGAIGLSLNFLFLLSLAEEFVQAKKKRIKSGD
jgi:hypothetical protein